MTHHDIRLERMSDVFVKFHLDGPWKKPLVLHHFSDDERDREPHDHPWDFVSHVLIGGYVEEVYHPRGETGYEIQRVVRRPGTIHTVYAHQIHRIVQLLDGPCTTLILPDYLGYRRETRFWDFSGPRSRSRAWHEKWPERAE